ncbi:hypothetical protein [Pseudonocardia sp.]|jgi:capsular polysaccharide biosynthesis protein|uniref:hypothetical protein n=1 Tax=Pseudonocardia sp. TaxID=60912 RepID=UPI003D141EE4
MSAPAGARPDASGPQLRWGRVPLSRRSRIVVAVAALVTAVVAALATFVALGAARPAYDASATVALVPAPGLTPQQASEAWKDINNGRATSVAIVVFRQGQWLVPAAAAAGVPVDRVSVTVAPGTASATGSNTALIDISSTAPSPSGAEAVAATVVEKAGPAVAQAAGAYVVQVTNSPEGTAVPQQKPRTEMLVIVALAGGVLGGGLTWLRVRGREAERRRARRT